MKRIIGMTLFIVMIFTMTAFGQVITPQTISDLDFMKVNYYKGSNNTFKNIHVGSAESGKVMSVAAHSNPNTDVYTLTVEEAGIVTIETIPMNKQYYTSLVIGDLLFVSDVSGEKKYYSAGDKNSIEIEDYNGYGHCLKSIYLDPGTYYFSVSGSQYSSSEQVSNYLQYVDYKITVDSQPYAKDPNIDTDQSNPYTFGARKDVIKGNVSMQMIYSTSSKKYYLDSFDRYMIPAGAEKEVKISVSNTNSNPLNLFKKVIEYKRNNDDKQNLEMRKLTSDYKSDSSLKVSVQKNGNIKLLSGESKELIVKVNANEAYYVDIQSNYPSEYTISYEVIDGSTVTQQSTKTDNNTVNAIIMLHTACSIPQETFDSHSYKIYINDVDYTNKQGYMGHITNLPPCHVGDKFRVRVEVDGYDTYEETISIPSVNEGENTILLVNVNTNKVAVQSEKIQSEETLKYFVGDYEVIQGEHYDGEMAMAQYGLAIKGGAFTNGRVSNGRRDGNMAVTKEKFNLKNKTIYGEYTIYGSNYAWYPGFGVENVIGGGKISTHHSWSGSIVVADGTKLFQTTTLTDSTYDIKIATGNYYDGSNLIYEDKGDLSDNGKQALNEPQSIHFYFGDNYGNESNYMVLHDLRIEAIKTEDHAIGIGEKKQLNEGDLVKLGTYNGEAIIWRYMGEDDKGSYLISDKILTFKGFGPIAKTIDGHDKHVVAPSNLLDRSTFGDPRWMYSPLKVWLNSASPKVDYKGNGVNEPLKFYTVTYKGDDGFKKYADNSYENEAGFLKDFTSSELNVIANVAHKTLLPSFDATLAEGGQDDANHRIMDYSTIANFKYADYNDAYYVTSDEKIFLPSIEEMYRFFVEKNFNMGAIPTQMAYDLDESKTYNQVAVSENHPYWLRTPKTKDVLSGISTSVYTIYPYFYNSPQIIDIFEKSPRESVHEMVYKRNQKPYQKHASGVRPACYLKANLFYFPDGEGHWVPSIHASVSMP